MNVTECKNSESIVTNALVLVLAVLFAKVLLLILTIVFTSIVKHPC